MTRRLLVGIGIFIAQCARVLGIRREVTASNLGRAYPNEPAAIRNRILSRSYTNLGRVFAEMFYVRWASKQQIVRRIRFDNPESFISLLAQGNGLIVVAGHLANWEWMALAGPLVLGTPFSVVVKNNPVARTERFLQRLRRRTGNPLINTADVRAMFRTLQQGGCVALLGDQAASAESVKVSFFGTTVPALEGPARLALRTRAPMLFAECVRKEPGLYHVRFIEVPYHDLKDDSPESVRELTQRHISLLEQAIREHPEQWVWQHRRWKNV